jgi:hypothetical protein
MVRNAREEASCTFMGGVTMICQRLMLFMCKCWIVSTTRAAKVKIEQGENRTMAGYASSA